MVLLAFTVGAGLWAGHAPRVLVVRGDASAKAGAAAAYLAQLSFDHTCQSLRQAHVPYRGSSDTQVMRLGLGQYRTAIFPYNRVLGQTELQRIGAWLAGGGRAVFVHALTASAASLLGLETPKPFKAAFPGAYHTLVFPERTLLGLPAEVAVGAEWVHAVAPRRGVQALGYLSTRLGRPEDVSALYLTQRGAYIPCLLVKAPPRQAGQLLRAIVAKFDPEIWDVVVPPSPEDLAPVEASASLAALLRDLARRKSEGPHIKRGLRAASEARAALARARELLAADAANAASDLANTARRLAVRAYWLAWPTREDELRGVWACNYAEPSWEVAAAALAAARFNVVFPYVASGAAAFYPSRILPPAAEYSAERDYLAEAIKACHAHGIRVHARILGLSCLFARSSTKARLKKEGRLMVTVEGKTRPWLCPTNPANRAQLVAAAVEIASRYAIDGLQFDYYRYPWKDVCTCARCRADFEKMLGRRTNEWPGCVTGPAKDLFYEFRRRQLDTLLAEVVAAVHKVRPDLPISAAVFINWPSHRATFGQDWVRWLRRKLIDFACPMNYTSSVQKFRQWTADQRKWAGDGVLCTGIGPFADGVGTFSPTTVAQQVAIARRYAQGWVLFNLRPELMDAYLPKLALGICYAPSSVPRWAGG